MIKQQKFYQEKKKGMKDKHLNQETSTYQSDSTLQNFRTAVRSLKQNTEADSREHILRLDLDPIFINGQYD